VNLPRFVNIFDFYKINTIFNHQNDFFLISLEVWLPFLLFFDGATGWESLQVKSVILMSDSNQAGLYEPFSYLCHQQAIRFHPGIAVLFGSLCRQRVFPC
jgi:hypothetical protein